MALIGLWEFGDDARDAAAFVPILPESGAECGAETGAETGAGGAVCLVFVQRLHLGPGDDLLARFSDGAGQDLAFLVTEDGALRVALAQGAVAVTLVTDDDLIAPDDPIRVTLGWGEGADGHEMRLLVENLAKGMAQQMRAAGGAALPDSIDAPAFWVLPGPVPDGGTGFVGRILGAGFYDRAADLDAIAGHPVPLHATEVIGGATLDLDSETPEARQSLDLSGLVAGAAYRLSLRASDIAAGGDTFRILWNGAPQSIDGMTEIAPPALEFADYTLVVTSAGRPAPDRIEFIGSGGPGGVAIAIEDLRLLRLAERAVPIAAGVAEAASVPGAATRAAVGRAAGLAAAGLSAVAITLEGGGSAQANTLGAYSIDPDSGAITGAQLLVSDTRSDLHGGALEPGTEVTYHVAEGAQVGLFLIGGGAFYNDLAALGPGDYVFLNAAGKPATLDDTSPDLYHLGADGTLTMLDGPVFHSAGHGARAALNHDAAEHLRVVAQNDDGTILFGFSDGYAAGADAVSGPAGLLVSVDPRAAGAELLYPALPGAMPAGALASLPEEHETDADTGTDTDTPAPGLLILLPEARVTPADAASVFDDEAADAPDLAAAASTSAPQEMSAELASSVIVPCFTPGTLIDTARGAIPVETLRPGDRVLTRDNGFQPIEWVGRKEVSAAELRIKPRFRGVQIRAGALGPGLPERDMVVSPQHRILVIGPEAELMFGAHEVLVPALHLIGLPGVAADPADSVTYIHIMCRRHEVVRSDGLWSESFQPGDLSLAGLDADQRAELLGLFPDLADRTGRENYVSARRSLQSYEARALFAPRRRSAKTGLVAGARPAS